MIHDWNIRSRSHTCALSGEPFVEKQPVYSALFYQDGDYQRKDFATPQWRDHVPTEGLLSAWQSPYKSPPAGEPEPVRKDDVESLLRTLLDRNNPQELPARYILALMLERKRVIREIERRKHDGRTLLIYEHLASGDVWMIVDPQLHLSQLEHVQHEVASLLQHGPPAPATPAS